jgi:hypothetical protein
VEQVREEVTKAQESFCETTLKRFRAHLSKFASENKISLQPDLVHKNCQTFGPRLKSRQQQHYLQKLAGLRRDISRTLHKGGSISEWTSHTREITLDFTQRIMHLFEEFLNASIPGLEEMNREAVADIRDAFHRELSQRSLRQTANILELFALTSRATPAAKAPPEAGAGSGAAAAHSDAPDAGPQATAEADDESLPTQSEAESAETAINDEAKEAACAMQDEEVQPKAPPCQKIEDLFGRGLLHPLDLYFQICDPDTDPHDAKKAVFPRRFCGPILHVSRSYLIGRDKYCGTNEQFLKCLRQISGKDEEFTREDCAVLFEEPRIKLFLMGYLLNNLKIFMKEIKQEKFMDNVNAMLIHQGVDETRRFEDRHFTILTNAWARFLVDNFDELKAKKTGRAVLKHYVPALVQKMEKREAMRRARA